MQEGHTLELCLAKLSVTKQKPFLVVVVVEPTDHPPFFFLAGLLPPPVSVATPDPPRPALALPPLPHCHSSLAGKNAAAPCLSMLGVKAA